MKLTNSQLAVLSAAAKRTDGSVLPLPGAGAFNAGTATLVLKSLLKHMLITAKPAVAGDPRSWRNGRDGEYVTLSITPAGSKAIGVDEPRRHKKQAATAAPPKKSRESNRDIKATTPIGQAARKRTKLSVLIELLSRDTGATIEEAAKVTGWQRHSVRGAISGTLKKKMGLAVTSNATDHGRIYRIGAA